jgi:hypothetical protein
LWIRWIEEGEARFGLWVTGGEKRRRKKFEKRDEIRRNKRGERKKVKIKE